MTPFFQRPVHARPAHPARRSAPLWAGLCLAVCASTGLAETSNSIYNTAQSNTKDFIVAPSASAPATGASAPGRPGLRAKPAPQAQAKAQAQAASGLCKKPVVKTPEPTSVVDQSVVNTTKSNTKDC